MIAFPLNFVICNAADVGIETNEEGSYFHSVNIGTILRFSTGKKLDIWDNSLYTLFQK